MPPHESLPVNIQNLQKQLRVGVQPPYSNNKEEVESVLSTYSDELLDQVVNTVQSVAASVKAKRQA